jgi:hypothetical protein
VGVIVLKGAIEGAGFAIPAADATAFLMRSAISTGDSGKIRRQWVGASGEHVVDAVLLSHDREQVALRRVSDNKEFTVPLDKLSTGDRRFLKLLAAAQQPSEAAK